MRRPTIRVRTEGGVEHDLDVPPEGTPARKEMDALIRRGAYTVVDAGGVAAYTTPDPGEATAPAPPADEAPSAQGGDGDGAEASDGTVPEPPAGNASHADWAAWAVEHGGLDEATAEAMTRDELRAAYTTPDPGEG